MSIIKQAQLKKYTTISNSLAQNNNLTLRARGLMLYLLSLPDNWQVHVNHLVKEMMEGREAILTALKELKNAGYVYLLKKGFTTGWEYFVFDSPPTPDELKEFLRTNGFANSSESQLLANPQLQIHTLEEKKEERESAREAPPPVAPLPPTFFQNGKVKMTQKEHDDLVKEFGEDRVREKIERLNAYASTHPKRFRGYEGGHGAVVRKWIVEDEQKEIPSTEEENFKLAKKIGESFPERVKDGSLKAGCGYIEFCYGPRSPSVIVKFGEPGFREACRKQLTRMGLSLDGL